MYKRLYYIGIVAYLCMLVLAVVLYKERTIISDTAFVLFSIARESTFSVQASRLAAVFTQSLPVFAVKTGFALPVIMISYSAAIILFHFFCYLVCGSVLKRYDYAMIILLANILLISDSFYWITSELPQSVTFLVLTLAWVKNKGSAISKPANIIVLVLLATALNFFHPLLIIALVYMVLFLMAGDDELISKKMLYLIFGVFVSIMLIRTLTSKTQYDRHSISGIKNFVTLFPNYFTTYATRQLLQNSLTKYFWFPVSFIAILVFYWKQNDRKKAALIFFVVTGYLLLVNTSYPTAATPAYYVDNLYTPVAFFLAVPLILDILPRFERTNMPVFLLVLIIGSAIFRLYATHNTYTSRLNWERDFLTASGNQKQIARTDEAGEKILQTLWGTPYEFWLLSTSERGTTASIIIDNDPPHRMWASELNKSFVVNWNVFPYSEMPRRYFRFTDTTSGYSIIK